MLNLKNRKSFVAIAADNFYLERAKTRNGQGSYAYIGVKIWNNISPTFKQLSMPSNY